ncbi:MAG: HPr family phosphocarrier protein [Ureaplasma sp.]|nr:HPr family phosphocarrier protein [Ureaplasma sp.]
MQKTFVLKNNDKFDVELATNIVNTLSDFNSTVIIRTSTRAVDANSIINLMTLSLKNEKEIILDVNGADADYTINELQLLLTKSGLI